MRCNSCRNGGSDSAARRRPADFGSLQGSSFRQGSADSRGHGTEAACCRFRKGGGGRTGRHRHNRSGHGRRRDRHPSVGISGRCGRAEDRQRNLDRCIREDLGRWHLGCRRLCLVSARRKAHPARERPECNRSGGTCRREHSGGWKGVQTGALVLVGSVRCEAADRRSRSRL